MEKPSDRDSLEADLAELAETYERIAESFRKEGDDTKVAKYKERARRARLALESERKKKRRKEMKGTK